MSESNVEKNSTKRQRTGGRQKGTPNKKTEYAFEVLKKHNFCPIEYLVYVAKNDWKALGFESEMREKQGYQGITYLEYNIPIELRVDAAKDLMPYLYPKRRAIEISNPDDKKLEFSLSYNSKDFGDNEKS
ncbi:MAG TPA: hypothetical protein V6C58_24745 [Allocoleopsis sp.]